MNSNEEQLVEPIELGDELVMQYLLEHPEFFIRNARLVEQMRVPHPVRDSVSLVEWQLSRQREQIGKLEEEITLLMELANANERLFRQLVLLQGELGMAESLQDLLDRLHQWARSLGLSSVDIRLFSEQWKLSAPSRFAHLALSRQLFEPLRIQRLGSNDHYLGTLNSSELLLLMPNTKHVGSVALSLLGENGDLGVLIFSSRDSQHYQPNMGTLLLQHLSLFLPKLLQRWIEKV